MNWALSLIFGGHSFGKSRKAAEKSSTVRWEKINKQQWRNNDLKVQEELRNSREECCHADDIICKKLGSAMHLIKKLFFWYLKLWVYRGRDQLMKSSTPFTYTQTHPHQVSMITVSSPTRELLPSLFLIKKHLILYRGKNVDYLSPMLL